MSEEEDEDLEWERDGERWLDKKNCVPCAGSGLIASQAITTCSECEGKGFVDCSEEGAILCPKCRGVRQVKEQKSSMCSECRGKGFHPVIMQRFVATVNCPSCDGTGRCEEEIGSDEFEECYVCEGSGKESHKEFCSLPEWSTSPLNPKKGQQTTWSDGSIEFLTEGGTSIEIDDCPCCELRIDPECTCCHGLGRVVVITQPCSECEGNGQIEIMEFPRCPECDGTGEKLISENRQV